MDESEPLPAPARRARFLSAYTRITTPTEAGLPNRVVLFAFPALVLAALVVLVALGINGTSSGLWWARVGHVGPDPDLVGGSPRPIRVDEWAVQTGWVVSQVAQGFPATNHVLPGGMDAAIMSDVPSWDWTTLFRPHLWGFLAFGLDHGMAVRWWVPAALMLVAIYAFTVTLAPRQPVLGAALALTVLFQPLLQWTWLPSVFAPVTFAFAAMTAAIWGLRGRGFRQRWIPALVAAYLAADMGMSIYIPFMIVAVLAATAVILGICLEEWRTHGRRLAEVAKGLVPLLVAGAGAVVVMVGWSVSHADAVKALLGTVYPGDRSTPTGSAGKGDLAALFSAPFQRSLQADIFQGMGPQQTDAASVLLVSLFLIVPLVAIGILRRRATGTTDWLVVMVVGVQLLFLAWLFLPGWTPLSRVLLLDKIIINRVRLFFLVMGAVSVVVAHVRLTELGVRVRWVVAGGAAALVLLASVLVWVRLDDLGSAAVPSKAAVVVTLALAAAVVLVARRRATPAALLLLAASLLLGAGVNPLYRGTFDMRSESRLGKYVVEVGEEHPTAAWVGLGEVSNYAIVEAGVPAYNGVQTYPPKLMWEQIDPDRSHEEAWNRYAGVSWLPGDGPPDPRLADEDIPDQVVLTFDPCEQFAQEHVDYLAVDSIPVDQPCLERQKVVKQNDAVYIVYRVVPPA